MASAFPRDHIDSENVHPSEQYPNDVLGKKYRFDGLGGAVDCGKRVKKVVHNGSKTSNDGLVAQKQSVPLSTITNTIAEHKVETEPNKLCARRELQNGFKEQEMQDESENLSQAESMDLDSSIVLKQHKKDIQLTVPLYSDYNDYSEENCAYLISLENRHAPRVDYMSRQIEVNASMRSILVDWLVSVTEEYQMNSDTLHRTVAYIDRFLSKMSVAKYKFQLVGTAALLVASKYEEIYPPSVKEMVHLTSDTYTVKEMLRMEQMMLRVLNFELGTPTVHGFIGEFCRKRDEMKSGNESITSLQPVHPRTRWLAQFLGELCLLQGGSFLRYPSSCIAAAALKLAEITLDEKPSTPVKKRVTRGDRNRPCNVSGYSLQQLSPVMARQNAAFKNSPTSPHRAVVEKFSSSKFASVALVKPVELLFDDL